MNIDRDLFDDVIVKLKYEQLNKTQQYRQLHRIVMSERHRCADVARGISDGCAAAILQHPDADDPPAEPRRVVCAAIRAADGELLLGVRHYSQDMIRQLDRRSDRAKFEHRMDADQGFVDQHGEWMGRQEAYAVAALSGQILHPDKCGRGLDGKDKLYSEGLY